MLAEEGGLCRAGPPHWPLAITLTVTRTCGPAATASTAEAVTAIASGSGGSPLVRVRVSTWVINPNPNRNPNPNSKPNPNPNPTPNPILNPNLGGGRGGVRVVSGGDDREEPLAQLGEVLAQFAILLGQLELAPPPRADILNAAKRPGGTSSTSRLSMAAVMLRSTFARARDRSRRAQSRNALIA